MFIPPPSLQHWLERSSLILTSPNLVERAVRDGEIAGAKWLVENGHKVALRIVAMLAERQAFEDAAWFLAHGGKIGRGDVGNAVIDNIAAARWLAEHGGVVSANVVLYVVIEGALEDAEWFFAHFAHSETIDRWDVGNAGADNHMAAARWPAEHGGAVSDGVVANAARAGAFEDAERFLAHGGTIGDQDVWKTLVSYSHKEAAKWLAAHGGAVSDNVVNYLLRRGDDEGVAWFSRYVPLPTDNNFPLQEVEHSPLTVVDNGLKTIVALKDKSHFASVKTGKEVYKMLHPGSDPDAYYMKFHVKSNHGWLELNCQTCDTASGGYHKQWGLYPQALQSEGEKDAANTVLTFYLASEQAHKVHHFIQDTLQDCSNGRQKSCMYDAEKHNCVDFLQDAYLSAGFQGDFASYLAPEQYGFDAIALVAQGDMQTLRQYQVFGYLYARANKMTNTIKMVVAAHEALEAAGEWVNMADDFRGAATDAAYDILTVVGEWVNMAAHAFGIDA
jgi:hypothetical protein